ncbi:MAG TPA: hypothetical protein EYQ83_13775 [Acidobacteria bacterium]|nr:hypothetical protein [Acidobacteriota bacterium]
MATVDRGATTIDALFAPLEVTETSGRVWTLDGDMLRPVEVRLGVTDGTSTELLGVRGGGGRRAVRQTGDPQIAELRQQIAALEESDARQNLERLLEGLEADAPAPEAAPMMAAALSEGATLVTGVTTPEGGSVAGGSGGGSSPLMPQFGRGRRR